MAFEEKTMKELDLILWLALSGNVQSFFEDSVTKGKPQ
jgi:hypothetical protein